MYQVDADIGCRRYRCSRWWYALDRLAPPKCAPPGQRLVGFGSTQAADHASSPGDVSLGCLERAPTEHVSGAGAYGAREWRDDLCGSVGTTSRSSPHNMDIAKPFPSPPLQSLPQYRLVQRHACRAPPPPCHKGTQKRGDRRDRDCGVHNRDRLWLAWKNRNSVISSHLPSAGVRTHCLHSCGG